MYINFYGVSQKTRPAEAFFERSDGGYWACASPSLHIYEIMDAIEKVNLKLLQKLYCDPDDFWNDLEHFDFDLIHAGLDPEAKGSKDDFNNFLSRAPSGARKIVFYYSVRGYSHAAQNILNHISISLGDAYELLSRANLEERVPLEAQSHGGEHYRNLRSPNCHRIWEKFNFCIEKSISFLDFITKYVAEISSIKEGDISGKLNASSVTFGKWKHLKLAKNTTLCTYSDELTLLTTLRDETVHNGTIDHFSRIYEHAVGEKVQARFLLFPDHVDGKIQTASGRRRFFTQDNHLNGRLPYILEKVFSDALSSLNEIDERLPVIWADPQKYYDRYRHIFEMEELARASNAFVKYVVVN